MKEIFETSDTLQGERGFHAAMRDQEIVTAGQQVQMVGNGTGWLNKVVWRQLEDVFLGLPVKMGATLLDFAGGNSNHFTIRGGAE